MRGETWRVVGGETSGGVLARTGRLLNSEPLERLSHGALVSELDLVGDRLHFRKISGARASDMRSTHRWRSVDLRGVGPESGWLSIKLKDKDLARRTVCDSKQIRIWALSDIHTDKKENMEWVDKLPEFRDDVLILAGDVANTMEVLQQTLLLLKKRFARVFFCPGNHDLWTQGWRGDSMEKLRAILDFCGSAGIETRPGVVDTGGQQVLVVPLLAWHQPQWDSEKELEEWEVPPVEKTIADYWATKWPPPLRIDDGSVARAVDELNEENGFAEVLARRKDFQVLSFSHFLPRIELNPEKRYLIPSCLAKAVGSLYLKERVQRLKPDLHVFGHTHFGFDLDVDGIRYLQAPLGTPLERAFGGSIVSLGDFPEGAEVSMPCSVWGGNGWAERQRSAWSEYYRRYGRCPEVTATVPSVCSNIYTPKAGSASGWIRGRMPIWLFGPKSCRLREAQQVIDEVRSTTGWAQREKPRKLQRSSSGRPKEIDAEDAARLLQQDSHVFVDIRSEGGCASAISLPHPAETEALAAREEEDLLQLCERLNAKGAMVVCGEDEEATWDAAMLLGGYFRIWPTEMTVLQGAAFLAWQQSATAKKKKPRSSARFARSPR
ncbi:unnamed protein product [Effrenium voratum]|nr:unnamed protein product [Effrenium voratum]